MKELVEFLVRSLVERPEAVSVQEHEADGKLVLELRVDSEDLGVVLGRKGRTASAIRTLLSVASARTQQQVSLEILD